MDCHDITEGFQEIVIRGALVRAGFRLLHADEFAGGIVDLEFYVDIPGPESFYLAVGGDRMAQRPGGFAFNASFAGSALSDPCLRVRDLGGPLGIVEVDAKSPWHQPIALNQFVRLEDACPVLALGAVGCLEVQCHRTLSLATDPGEALTARDGRATDVSLCLSLRRDDLAVEALAESLADEVAHGRPVAREQALSRLLSLRGSAEAQLQALANHPDPALAERITRSLRCDPLTLTRRS